MDVTVFSPYGIFTKDYYYERGMFVCIEQCSVAGIKSEFPGFILFLGARFELCYANSHQMF